MAEYEDIYRSSHTGPEIDNTIDDSVAHVDDDSKHFTPTEKYKLSQLENYDDSALTQRVASNENNIAGLQEHTVDFNVHVGENDRTNWNNKVDSIPNKGLSTNDFTNELKETVEGLAAGTGGAVSPATTISRGTVKIGAGINVTEDGTISTAIGTDEVAGGVKSGDDISIDAEGNMTISDNSHGHSIENVEGLQTALDAKLDANSAAVSADKLTTPINITFTGAVTSSAISIDGSDDLTINTLLADHSHDIDDITDANKIFTLTGGTSISTDVDLNTIIDIGNYYRDSVSVSTYDSDNKNSPTSYGFILKVYHTFGGAYNESKTQELTVYTDGEFLKYVRSTVDNGASWGDWINPSISEAERAAWNNKLDSDGNAVSASKLNTPINIEFTGAITGTSANVDGSQNISIDTALSGHTHDTSELTDFNTMAWAIQGGVELPENVNLDNVTTIGNFFCSSTARVLNFENCPTEHEFTMKVFSSTGTGSEKLCQELIPHDITAPTYRRFSDDSGTNWSGWVHSGVTNAERTDWDSKLDASAIDDPLTTYSLINALPAGTVGSIPEDNDYYISQYIDGNDVDNNTYRRRRFSSIWDYIKNKADVVYSVLAHTHTASQISDLDSSANLLKDGTPIPDYTDLDDINTIGNYYASSADTFINSPVSVAFTMKVFSSVGIDDAYLKQVIYPHNSNDVYERYITESDTGWSAWTNIAVTSTDRANWDSKADSSHTHTIDNIDDLQDALDGKVDKVADKGLSTNDYTTDEKSKLAGIASGANNYTLPVASDSALGGVKSGGDITIDSSTGEMSVVDGSHNHTIDNVSELQTALDGKVDKVADKGLSTNDYTTDEKSKLAGIASGANNYTLPVASDSVLGGVKSGGDITIDSSTGVMSVSDNSHSHTIGNIDDLQDALDNKVDKVADKGLSTNDYTTTEKTKLAGIASGANNYTLPVATSSVLGGVKSGGDVTINSSTGAMTVSDNSHNHTSSNVNALTGYSKPESTSEIIETDTLNEALGKLEKGLEDSIDSPNTWTFANGSLIPSGTDLNAVINVGNYYTSTTIAMSIVNRPILAGFTMKVFKSMAINDKYLRQILMPYNETTTYERYTIDKGINWSAWRETSGLVSSWSLDGGVAIAASTDIDTLTDDGNYYSEDISTLSNLPEPSEPLTTSAFTMKVFESSGLDSNNKTQELRYHDCASIYTRSTCDCGTNWGEWVNIAVSDSDRTNWDSKADGDHTHTSDNVNAMTGYSKPDSTSAIGTTDTLNAAVGKLEKALDNKLNIKPDNTNNLIDNNKINNAYLPDVLLGQLTYGGNVNPQSGVATLSANAKSRLNTSASTLTLTNDTTDLTGYITHEGLFYIATVDSASGNDFASLNLKTGDWLISTGSAWTKIDNTDTITGVKGDNETTYRTGNINITPENIGAAATSHTHTPTEVGLGNVPNVSTNNQSPTYNTAEERTNLISGETLSTAFGKLKKWLSDLGSLAFKSTVVKSDLDDAVQTSLDKADSALQSFTESDPTVPAWAKTETKPTYTAADVGALPLTGGTLTGELVPDGGIAVAGTGTGGTYIAYPKDGKLRMVEDFELAGYLKITLPQSWSSTMLKFRVSIFNYVTGSSCDYYLSGFLSAEGKWYNVTAYSIGHSGNQTNSNLTVSFGHDGTKCAVYIGTPTTRWVRTGATVTDITTTYVNPHYSNWDSGWDVSITPTLGTITQTVTNPSVTYLSTMAVSKTGDTMTGELVPDGGIAAAGAGTGGTYIAYPKDGKLRTSLDSVAGYLKIQLPQSWTNTMLSFKVSIYNHYANTSCEYFIAGYIHESGTAWSASTASSIGSNGTQTISNLPVKFGHDGTKCAVYIGNANTVWYYPQVTVHDITAAFQNKTYEQWASGWNVSITTTLGTITRTVENPSISYLSTLSVSKTGDTMTGELIPDGGIAAAGTGTNGTYIAYPKDGKLRMDSAFEASGYLKITLPRSWSTTMLKFRVSIFNYVSNTSCDYYLSGFLSEAGAGSWTSVTAFSIGFSKNQTLSNLPVQFGHDGTKCAVYIGTPTTRWVRSGVTVTDITALLGNSQYANWVSGWNVEITTTLGTITQTVAAPCVSARIAELDYRWSLQGGTAIPENANLDSYKTPGNYYCQLTTTAQSINTESVPVTPMSAFTLKVYSSNGSSVTTYIKQLLDLYDVTGGTYTRTSLDGGSTWGNWVKTSVTASDRATWASEALPLTGGTLTGELVPDGGIAAAGTKTGGTYIAYPKDGKLRLLEYQTTGYLKITLPQSWTNTMVAFKVLIYNYVSHTSCEYFIGGYTYIGESIWTRQTASSIGVNGRSIVNLPVRFGHDGTKCAIYIGKDDTLWTYPQVTIHDISTGYESTEYSKWASGWSIGITTTLGTISQTVMNPSVSYLSSRATTLETARNINGHPFDGSADITLTENDIGTTYRKTITLPSGNHDWHRIVSFDFDSVPYNHGYIDFDIYSETSSLGSYNGGMHVRVMILKESPEPTIITEQNDVGMNMCRLRSVWGTDGIYVDIMLENNKTYVIKSNGSLCCVMNDFTEATVPNGYSSITYGVPSSVPSGGHASIWTNKYINANITGSASKLETARNISLTGAVTGTGSFDGSADLSITTSIVNGEHTHTLGDVTDLITELDKRWTLSGGTSIPQNANLNDYTTIGNYYCISMEIARSLTNAPVGVGFTMKVYRSADLSSMYIKQVLDTYNTSGETYTRTSTNGGTDWTDWVKTSVTSSDRATWDGKAEAVHTHTAANVGALPLTGGTMTGELIPDGGIAAAGTESNGTYIAYPKDGKLRDRTEGGQTGYLKITLPRSWTNTMISFKVSISNYAADTSCEYFIEGFTSTSGWTNCTARSVGAINTASKANLPVKFGHTTYTCAVYIGGADIFWAYPQVTVHDITVGYANAEYDKWDHGWDVEITTAIGSITQTITNPCVSYLSSRAEKLNTTRTITLAGDATGSMSFDGSTDKTLTVTVANNSHTHTIANVSELRTSLDAKVDKEADKGLSTNDYTTTEKNKLAGIATNANKYILPVATSGTLGGVKSGGDITIDSSTGVMSVVDDSHNHIISNVDGLQDALNGKLSISGTAAKASKLATIRNISLTGDVTGSGSFDGSAALSIDTTVADDSHNHSTAYITGLDEALDRRATLSGGTAIPENANLNSYKTPGNYCCQLTTTAQSINTESVPVTPMSAFTLKVYSSNGSSAATYVKQILDIYNVSSAIYIRTSTNAGFTWGNWVKICVSNSERESWDGKAEANHTHTAADVGALPLTGGTLTGELVPNSGIAAAGTETGGTYIAYPKDGKLRSSASPITGYLKITLPQTWTRTMIYFKVSIYNYFTHTSCEYSIGGYTYGGEEWLQYTASSVGSNSSQTIANLPVGFGHDGSKCAVYIGNANTVWYYPQVTVHDITVGYQNAEYDKWDHGWNVSITTTLGTITQTVTNPCVSYLSDRATKLNTARNINNHPFDGSEDIVLTANDVGAYSRAQSNELLGDKADVDHIHVFANVSGLQTALDGKVDKVTGKGLSTNDYTTAEKSKLAAIEASANRYILPIATSNVPGGVISGGDVTINPSTGAMTVVDDKHNHTIANVDGLSSALNSSWTLYEGIAILSNSDLNTYTAVGNYYCTSIAFAITLLNRPLNDMGAFTLKVYRSAGISASYIKQVLDVYNASGETYTRTSTNGGSEWGDWTRTSVTGSDRTSWNSKAEGDHTHTAVDIGAAPQIKGAYQSITTDDTITKLKLSCPDNPFSYIVSMMCKRGSGYGTFIVQGYGEGSTDRYHITPLQAGSYINYEIDGTNILFSCNQNLYTWYSITKLLGADPTITTEVAQRSTVE